MKLVTQFGGADMPFEGDQTFTLSQLPVGAQIGKATVSLTPVAGEHGAFVEPINFSDGPSWGATKTRGNQAGANFWVQVDFHARRTLFGLQGAVNRADAMLQVDMGGAFVRLDRDGTMWLPGGNELLLNLDTGQNTSLPGLTVNRLRVFHPIAPVDLKRVTVLSHPSQVSLRLGEMAPFWTRTGELTETGLSSDFSQLLQVFLAEAETRNGFYRVPLTIHSDLIARLMVMVEIEYVRQSKGMPHDLEEVRLPFDFASLPQTEPALLSLSLPTGARALPQQTSLRVRGSFEESRVVFGTTGVIDAPALVPVKQGLSQAQAVFLKAETPVTAIDLLLAAVTKTAVVNVNLLPDSDGKPFGESLLSRPVTLKLNRDTNGALGWLSASLAREFLFKAQTVLWLVVQTMEGEVVWGADSAQSGTASPGLQFSDSSGLAWRQTTVATPNAPLEAFFRLRYTPTRFQMPIELLVGEGKAAQRVSLDRFQPLGRVDFTLDFDEVSDAINTYADLAGENQDQAAEQVVNGMFERWSPAGTKPVSAVPAPLASGVEQSRNPIALAASPFRGETFVISYEAVNSEALAGHLHRTDGLCGPPTDLPLAYASLADGVQANWSVPTSLAVNENGQRVFVASMQRRNSGEFSSPFSILHLVDGENMVELGRLRLHLPQPVGATSGIASDWFAGFMVLHPKGRKLYLGVQNGVEEQVGAAELWVLDVPALENAVTQGRPNPLNDVLLTRINWNDPETGLTRPIKAMKLSPEGDKLFLTVTEPGPGGLETGRLLVIDTVSEQVLPDSLSLNTIPFGLEIAPDGKTLFAAEKNRLLFIETSTMRETQAPINLSGVLSGIGLSGDGDLLFAGLADPREIRVFDWKTRNHVHSLTVPEPVYRMASEPDGNRVFAILGSEPKLSAAFLSIQVGAPLPAGWTLTQGRISPLRFPSPLHRAAKLGYPPGAAPTKVTGLSQVVAVKGGSTYQFSHYGVACKNGAQAELCLLNESCGPVRVDRFPVEKRTALQTASLALHRHEVEVPAEVTQIEIRFLVPEGNNIIVDRVSLGLAQPGLTDGGFVDIRQGNPAHWSLEPNRPDDLVLTPGADGLVLVNRGPGDLILSQKFRVSSSQPYVAALGGRALSGENNAPQWFLSWKDKDGKKTAKPISAGQLTANFARILLEGFVPATATEGEIRLLLPSESRTELEMVSFDHQKETGIPISFVAQSPGELTVWDTRLAYEEGDPPQAEVPAKGFCPPTPPGRKFGQKGDQGCCCCPCCEKELALTQAVPVVTDFNRPAVLVECPDCSRPVLVTSGPVVEDAASVTVLDLAETGQPGFSETTVAISMEDSSISAVVFEPSTAVFPLLRPTFQPSLNDAEAEKNRLAANIAETMQDPVLQPLAGFKLSTINDWSTDRLVKKITAGNL